MYICIFCSNKDIILLQGLLIWQSQTEWEQTVCTHICVIVPTDIWYKIQSCMDRRPIKSYTYNIHFIVCWLLDKCSEYDPTCGKTLFNFANLQAVKFFFPSIFCYKSKRLEWYMQICHCCYKANLHNTKINVMQNILY